MSTLHSSNRMLFKEREAESAVSLPAWVAIGLLGVVAFAGMHLGAWMERQVTPAPEVRVVPARTPLTQWTCAPQERAEYLEACKRRALSAITKPRER